MLPPRTHLDHLESQSIYILREAFRSFKNIAMPWSMGKDSNVLIWLSLKSFFGKIPYPVLHIDTTYEFPEMLEFRAWATAHYKLNLIVKINEEARARGVGYETHDPVTVTHELKSVALHECAHILQFRTVVDGRRDAEVAASNRLFPGTGVEGQADCMSFHLTRDKRYFGYVRGCSKAQLADASRMWRAYGKKYQAADYRWGG